MKNFISLLAACLMVFVACEPISSDDPTASSITITSKTDVSINSGSTMGMITYTINNPTTGYEVKATPNVEWINSFDYSQMGKITYKVDANPTFDPRSGVVTVSYGTDKIAVNFTQKGKDRPKEISVEVPYLLGHYFGDYANNGNYNYYLAFSESDYDAQGSFYAAGYKYFLDIYSTERPEDYNHIRVPNGVYTFNPNNDGMAGTFLESYSIYKEYDNSYIELGQKPYSEGVLTVEDDMIKLEVMFIDEPDIYVVTFNGDYSMMDKRSESGGIY